MQEIRVIRGTADLQGTCYFEFLPGEYKGKCWNDDSVFLHEETFGLIEQTIARNEPRFDNWSFVDIRRPGWERIIHDLENLERRVATAASVGHLPDAVR